MNGNYAVFQLRKQPLDGPRPKALEVRRWLDDHSNWQDYAQLCERRGGREDFWEVFMSTSKAPAKEASL